MSKIADKKFEILGYVSSSEYSVDGLAKKLNELTDLVKNLPLRSVRNSKTFDFTYKTDVKEKRLP